MRETAGWPVLLHIDTVVSPFCASLPRLQTLWTPRPAANLIYPTKNATPSKVGPLWVRIGLRLASWWLLSAQGVSVQARELLDQGGPVLLGLAYISESPGKKDLEVPVQFCTFPYPGP